MSRAYLPLLVCFVAACAEPRPVGPDGTDNESRHRAGARWLERGNWVVEWSAYAPREQIVDGKRVMTMLPTPGASQHVRDADSPPRVDGGVKVNARLTVMATAELEAGTIDLDVGTVAERNVPQDRLEALAVAGDSVVVYWTWRRRSVVTDGGLAVEIPFSTIFIEAVHPGKTELFLHWPDSIKKTLVVNVRGASP